jgi:hypothetical protein
MSGVGIMRDQTLKRRDLNASHTLGYADRKNSKSSIGSSGPPEARVLVTRKKPKDLSVRAREERGYGECGDVYAVCKCE